MNIIGVFTGNNEFFYCFPFSCGFIVYNNHVGYSLKVQTHRYVFPQMKWSVLNLTTDGEIISRNF